MLPTAGKLAESTSPFLCEARRLLAADRSSSHVYGRTQNIYSAWMPTESCGPPVGYEHRREPGAHLADQDDGQRGHLPGQQPAVGHQHRRLTTTGRAPDRLPEIFTRPGCGRSKVVRAA